MNMDTLNKVKAVVTAASSALSLWLGILAIPVYLLLGCNVVDYVTGLAAAKYRSETISSYKSIRGIIKKVCTLLLVAVGVFVDVLIEYATQAVGLELQLGFLVASVVAVWLICNEILSILENIADIGVPLPPILTRLVEMVRGAVESKTGDKGDEDDEA